MIIEPKIRGFICTSAHPLGCEASVKQQIEYVKSQSTISGPQHALVIGASTGYGLASRIVATFAANAKTLGVIFEKPAQEKRTATPGWYNTAAFEAIAHREGHYAKSINGDAFSDSIKSEVAKLIRQDLKKVDLVIYSVAAPRRIHPKSGEVYNSVLKPIDQSFSGKTVDAFREELKDVSIAPAKAEEITNTVKVMGGEDWAMWITFLLEENLLAENAVTIAYSYLGPSLTHSIYKNGTIGKAKEDLKNTRDQLNTILKSRNGKALISINKAVVTQASAAIPVVPLYIALLFKVMKAKGIHEGCIEQMYRLFKNYLYAKNPLPLDGEDYIRLDDLEMRSDVQEIVFETWPLINNQNLSEYTDLAGYRDDFYRLFGFAMPGVDYQRDVDAQVKIESIDE